MNEIFLVAEALLSGEFAGVNFHDMLALYFLIFARISAFVTFTPYFGGQTVAVSVKVGLAAVVSLIALPVAGFEASNPLLQASGTNVLMMLFIKEFLYGFTLGFAASLVFSSIEGAGRLIDIQRGSAMSELRALPLNYRASETGVLYLHLALAVFFAAGFHRHVLSALIGGFETLPVARGNVPHGQAPEFVDLFATTFAQMFASAVQLAMPAVVALLLIDFGFGILNRVAPQMNVFFLSLPVKMYVGLLVVLGAIRITAEELQVLFTENLNLIQTLLRIAGQ
jgi:flagellar biosynthetic protein FliR